MSDYVLALSDAEVARYQLMAEKAQSIEAAWWAEAGIVEGAKVADVGCGPGVISSLTAQLVGPSGEVWAVDQDEQAVALTEALAARLGLENVHFQVGGATATGLDPGSFDVVIMRHVLAHNGGHEETIVAHLASLLRPGGSVYLVDVEIQAMRVRPPHPELKELGDCYRAFHAARGNDLSVGLRLAELVKAAGLEQVEHRGWYDIVPAPPGMRPPSWAGATAWSPKDSQPQRTSNAGPPPSNASTRRRSR